MDPHRVGYNPQRMDNNNETEVAPRRRFRKRWVLWGFGLLWAAVGAWNTIRPMPPGTAVRSAPAMLDPQNVQFLTDLTYNDPRGGTLHEHRIFDEVLHIVDEAETFIVADFFLFNDLMGAAEAPHRALSRELADRLIARKAAMPELTVLLITDPINDVYGSVPSPLLDDLRRAGIQVVVTDLRELPDSNPAYSALWRLFGQWFGNSPGAGSLPNPFDTEPAKISLRSWLALLNFKANHRKLIVADRADAQLVALVTSVNPHDGSSGHSNVALRFVGALALDMVTSELGIARFSGWNGHILAAAPEAPPADPTKAVQLAYVTEKAIRDHLLDAIDTSRNGDSIRIATFYLADRGIVSGLLRAAQRNVTVQLILDPNRDAFGRQKDGVPNRPVANELVTQSGERIQVRWYRTHGEQFHTKLALITHGDRLIASLGSANLTRRNIGNYNLEANVAVAVSRQSPLATQMEAYFDRLWNNQGPPGTEFTASFGAYQDTGRTRYWRYRFMEATGLSTF
ncbi:phospholipase D-like domain-containing protein [Povalibacter sp.]|uniref:phospholipase D-like domain-containing protein n=1 Tax=Povalibacter sp. TaxID=1962978 RepID=UPI002F3FE624